MKVDEVKQVTKKPKIEVKDEVDTSASADLDKKIADQNKEFYKIHDKLKAKLKKAELIEILEKNKQQVLVGTSEVNIFILNFFLEFILICILLDTKCCR